MSKVRLHIDGREVEADEGTTVLEAARGAGISIPTMCQHDELEPWGGCRLCLVEIEVRGWQRSVVACVYPVEEDLVVTTRSVKIDRIRKVILELLLAHAPDAPALKDLAGEYGADPHRFPPEPAFCVHCGLCVRYCAEVKGLHAVGFVDRGIRKEIAFLPDIARTECEACKECFPLCPTSWLQAAWVRMEGLRA